MFLLGNVFLVLHFHFSHSLKLFLKDWVGQGLGFYEEKNSGGISIDVV